MKIQFLQRVNLPDGLRLSYLAESKKVYLEISGTAMCVYNLSDLSEKELGTIFIPVILDIYARLNEQGVELRKISMASNGIRNNGKIIYSKEKIEEVLKRKSRRLVMGEYWDVMRVESGDGKPFKIFNSHQKTYESSGSYAPDLIDSFSTEKEAIDFLYKQ